MKEIAGDIWDYYDKGNWIVITTNGTVKKNGEAVMGKGIALQVKQRFPDFPRRFGEALTKSGNNVKVDTYTRIFTFPVKHNWRRRADLKLVEESCKQLVIKTAGQKVYMVRPGCGAGQLDWKTEVKPILEKYFVDDRFIIVERER